ncbi:MAG TPA: hypothetical protein VJ969_01950 [Desulfopila sp.]|nr:hypothetical protein [Desulfopila sp.]
MADQKAGSAATIALIAAIVSFILTFTGSPIWALVVALVAVGAGILGVLMAASPKIGGGLMSILAIILGVLDTGIAVLGIVGVIIF